MLQVTAAKHAGMDADESQHLAARLDNVGRAHCVLPTASWHNCNEQARMPLCTTSLSCV